jgi:predicted DsbA family dithiol-disulfide isomerase
LNDQEVAVGMQLEIWSDVACPWCYIGKRRLETALERFPHRDEVLVRFRSFQLDPTTPRSRPEDVPGVAPHLAAKYGVGLADAEQMVARVDELAVAEGLELHQDAVRHANTADAHRLLHAAAEPPLGGPALQSAVTDRFMRAYFTEGQRIDDPVTLRRLAVDAGIDGTVADDVLSSDAYAHHVAADQAEAAALGARGVPFFVVDRRIGVSGAQPVEVFTQLLEQAWAQRQPV